MKKLFLYLLISLPTFHLSYSQLEVSDTGTNNFMDRVYFGGNVGLQFGNVTFIDISPIMGYMVKDNTSIGIGTVYQYLDYKDIGFFTNVYGYKFFGRQNVSQEFFTYSEYENLCLGRFSDFSPIREWVPALFIGGGYQKFLGGSRGGFMIMILYNALHDNIRSPYNSPTVARAGFIF